MSNSNICIITTSKITHLKGVYAALVYIFMYRGKRMKEIISHANLTNFTNCAMILFQYHV